MTQLTALRMERPMRSLYATASFMRERTPSLQRWFLRCLPMVLAMAIPATTVHAQGYVPASKGDATFTKQNHWNCGQRSDLDIDFYHHFGTEPCPTPSESKVIKTCTINVYIDWRSVAVPTENGPINFDQTEGNNNCDSHDQFIFYWEIPEHWTLDSAQLDGEDIPTRGENPEGELFGNDIVSGVRTMVPMDFENGDNNFQPITYTIVLKYVPDEECDVEPLVVGGHYIHTYRGKWHVAITPELVIGSPEPGGIPALIPATGDTSYDWGWSSDAWQKHIFNPENKYDEHRKNLPLPENCVPRQGCCGDEIDDTPVPPQVHIQYVDNSNPGEVTVMATVEPTDGPLTSISIMGWTEDGIQIAQSFHAFEEPSWQTETFEVTCQLPADCNTDSLYFVATGRSLNSGSTDQGLILDNPEPQLPRFMDTDAIIDSRLVAPSILVAEIPVPLIEAPSISDMNHVYVVDQLEQVVDEEAPFKIVNNGDSYSLYYQVVESATRTSNNGVLEVLNHDFVQLFSQTSAEWDSIGIPVVTDEDPSAVNIFGAESVDMDVLQILGTATGGTFELDFGEGEEPATFATTPGASAEETASQMVDAINAMGFASVSAELYEPDKVRLIGERMELHVEMVDGGIDMRCFTVSDTGRPADFDNNGVVNGADLGLLLSAMSSQSTPDSRFDLTGDGLVDAADLGMLLADWG